MPTHCQLLAQLLEASWATLDDHPSHSPSPSQGPAAVSVRGHSAYLPAQLNGSARNSILVFRSEHRTRLSAQPEAGGCPQRGLKLATAFPSSAALGCKLSMTRQLSGLSALALGRQLLCSNRPDLQTRRGAHSIGVNTQAWGSRTPWDGGLICCLTARPGPTEGEGRSPPRQPPWPVPFILRRGATTSPPQSPSGSCLSSASCHQLKARLFQNVHQGSPGLERRSGRGAGGGGRRGRLLEPLGAMGLLVL